MNSISNNIGTLHRTPSATSSTSTTSSRKDKSSRTVRSKRPSRQTSTLKTPTTATIEDKSLTSFPALAPADDSPKQEVVVKRDGAGSAQASLAKMLAAEASKTLPTKSRPDLKPKRSMVAALTAKSPSAASRNSLFEDSPTTATHDVPGALHQASTAHIERMIARTGAVKLVRQLAEDLAAREAEMSALRQRSEARERELKKMLREVEVGAMDIESRLHTLDKETQTGKRVVSDGKKSIVGEMMEAAIEDAIVTDDDVFGSPESREEEDRQATIRAKALMDNASIASQDTTGSKTATRGWKDYLWSGTATKKTSRTQSLASGDEQVTARKDNPVMKRKGLDETLFKPPTPEDVGSIDKTRASSMSSWTMKLFAGNPVAVRDINGSTTVRGRSITSTSGGTFRSNDSRATSQTSVQTTDSTKGNLRKIDSRTGRRPIQPLTFTAGTKRTPSATGMHAGLTSPSAENPPSNLGPVEMDAILPHGSKPPTLTPSYYNIDNPDDLLTDRFGFIYDQRRRKKESEALARVQHHKAQPVKEPVVVPVERVDNASLHDQQSIGSVTPPTDDADAQSVKKWQDHLQMPSKPTELLSHTPSSNSIITLSNPAIRQSLRRTSTFENIKEDQSTPNPLPAKLSVTASHAELVSPVVPAPQTPVTPSKNEFEPVKMLLSQLTDLHDNLQREKTVKWNEFMRKVRVERRREEESAVAEGRHRTFSGPEANLADGETIGIATFGNKGKVGRAKYREFKMLVLAGIPVTLRAKVWAECSGASALRLPGYYTDLVAREDSDPSIVAQIQMDINRTLTDNVFFRRGPGVEKLNEVLLAYSRRNTEVGYCQGMNLITASLLLIMPTAEDAFWMLVSIIENILPRHYFDNSLLTSRADQQVLKQYVAELLPRLSAHLDSLSIDLEALTFQWFLSLFTACLSAEALYRVWDVLLCSKDEEGNGGSTFLFQVSLALLKLNETQLVALESPGEVYAYLGGEITNHAISIDGLIKASEGLKTFVRRSQVEERREKYVLHEKEVAKEREALRNAAGSNAELQVQEPLPLED